MLTSASSMVPPSLSPCILSSRFSWLCRSPRLGSLCFLVIPHKTHNSVCPQRISSFCTCPPPIRSSIVPCTSPLASVRPFFAVLSSSLLDQSFSRLCSLGNPLM
ncbi:hypothetical protein PHLGIDRAFT_28467 [Phlebiopsis gigantea 11061_1 CR5-6]|uniref:Uncharacterized protein n=1 Tax=Phlebiopsis gigantea (strain 11061_1 CR5-6) TaxID=745531 RepID=A0A0C3SEH9_PHLG1|nr:hypothetical protein PHLGIDRAFT_28467 [Phlebiopsis gigantea 11061_1 CR5-6]